MRCFDIVHDVQIILYDTREIRQNFYAIVFIYIFVRKCLKNGNEMEICFHIWELQKIIARY